MGSMLSMGAILLLSGRVKNMAQLIIAGVMIGFRFGAKYKYKAEIAGGVILFLIGLRILLEGLGFRLL